MCAGARAGQADRDQSQRQHPPGSDRPARKGRAGPDPVQSGSILMKRPVKLLMALAIAAAASGSALAQAADPVVEQASAQGVVGAQEDGYLGLAKSAAGAPKYDVDATHHKRRAFDTLLAR